MLRWLSLAAFAAVAWAAEPVPVPFAPTWESLERYQVPAWFRDAKFGIFVHWGPQTLAGSEAAGDGTKTRNWKELAAAFTGARFDADRVATLFKKSGAKYVVQVAEHHDGYALYDSTRTPWSSVKMNPRRDFVAELSAAVRKQGLIFGASSHTEENWWFYSESPKKLPPLPKPGQPATGEQPPKAWLDDWQARLVEIVEKYDPQIFWFDWSIEQPCYEPYLRQFAAYYYNRAAQRNQGVVLNYKYDAFPPRAAVRDISVNTGRLSWRPEAVHPVPWQFDTWSAQGLWFWRPTMKMRPTAALITELADVVSKNGNYLLNVTPDPDGVITPEQVQMLEDIGAWLAVNGEAIYGTRPWKVYGEGPTSGLGPSFSPTTPKTPYTSQDIRFTTKGDTLYAIVLAWPENGTVAIKSLADHPIKSVTLLGSNKPVKRDGLTFELPVQERRDGPFVLKVQAATPIKKPDPAYAPVTDEPKLPRVLLIGDSVSVGYTLAVRKELAGKANVHRPPQNCGSSAVGLANIEKWLGQERWDVIHFNHGLHDLSYEFSPSKNINEKGEYARPDNGGHHRVAPEEYRQNLTKSVTILRAKAPTAKLIFATTTPVSADLHHYVKDSELEYNRIAVEVMTKLGVPVNDLWAFAKPRIAEIQEPGNPHFTAKGSQVLAKEIARQIVEALQ